MKIAELIRNKQMLSLAGNLVMAFLNLATGSLLYHHLSQEAMGCWGFFQIIFILIDTFRTGFLQTSFIKFYAGTDKLRGDNVLGSTWVIGLGITGAIVAANVVSLLFLTYIKDPSIIVLIRWTGLFSIATLPIVMATWLLQAEQRYMEILYIRIVNQASFIIIVMALIYFDKLTLDTTLIFNFACNALTCVVVFGFKWTGIRTLPKQSKAAIAELYHFGKYSVGTSISANLLRSSDTIIIKVFLGNAAIAVYNVAQNLNNLLDIPLRSFVATGMSSIAAAENRNDREEVQKIFKKYAGALTILFIPAVLGLMLFADIAVKLLAGHKYVDTPAANLFRVFLVIALFLPLDRFVGVTLDVMHLPKVNFQKVLIMLGINIVGDLSAIYLLHNLYGVAIASVPTFMVGTMFGYFTLKRYLKIDMKDLLISGWGEAQVLVKMALSKVKGAK